MKNKLNRGKITVGVQGEIDMSAFYVAAFRQGSSRSWGLHDPIEQYKDLDSDQDEEN